MLIPGYLILEMSILHFYDFVCFLLPTRIFRLVAASEAEAPFFVVGRRYSVMLNLLVKDILPLLRNPPRRSR